MSLAIHLLGAPEVERDGVTAQSPRGNKPWALLVHLLRSERPPSRQQLASLLFPDADDPFGALRWSLSQLRRLLGSDAVLEGDPLRLDLSKRAFVDVEVLSKDTWTEAIQIPGLGRPLIEGVDLPRSPAFQLWLENERRHLAGLTEAILHEAAHASLARGAFEAAADHATRLVALNPFDENSQVLLVRCLRAANQPKAAARQVEVCTELFRKELGVEPSPALRTAVASAVDVAGGRHISARGAILAKLEAGESAVAAGALEAGLEALRGAATAARTGADRHLHARTMVALGSALVHAARGGDEEGAAALYEASAVAEELEDGTLAATALREIGWVELLRARYDRAEASLLRAAELAAGNDSELGWIHSVLGACRADTGDYPGARGSLASAVESAGRAGDSHAGAFARTLLGRLHLLCGEPTEARRALDGALELARAESWTSFIPFPESLRAEVDLMTGDVTTAAERFEHAFALGCQLGDPCWESIAARGLGLVAAAQGDMTRALELLDEAPRRCRRLPDSYLWVEAYAFDALCAVGIDNGWEAAGRWVDDLEAMASRGGMRELVVRAALHRAELGDEGAAEAAQALAGGIDNDALADLLDSSLS
ncbi:MAG: SARP family transcriptional regulator [Actinomycetota bacterium]|nr:SARP family transcriptional regulator [Actinomycetota bacterium]